MCFCGTRQGQKAAIMAGGWVGLQEGCRRLLRREVSGLACKIFLEDIAVHIRTAYADMQYVLIGPEMRCAHGPVACQCHHRRHGAAMQIGCPPSPGYHMLRKRGLVSTCCRLAYIHVISKPAPRLSSVAWHSPNSMALPWEPCRRQPSCLTLQLAASRAPGLCPLHS